MIQATLKVDLADNKIDDVQALIKRLKTLIKSNYGVLSGSMIWMEILHRLGVNAEKEILETFDISDLKTKIYGVRTLKLIGVNTATNSVFLLFKIDENVQKQCGTRNVSVHLAEIYKYIKLIKSESVLIAEVDITTNNAEINFSKDDPVSHDIVANMFGAVADIYTELNDIRSETGVELDIYMTAVGILFESSKDDLTFSISVTKNDIDKATDMAKLIQNTIDIAIKKVIE